MIPGARTPEQARANAAAAEQPELSDATLDAVRDIYDGTHPGAGAPPLVAETGTDRLRLRGARASMVAGSDP